MSHKLNHQVIFEGLDKLDQEHHLLGLFVDKQQLYDHIYRVAEKSLQKEEDITDAVDNILKNWISPLYRHIFLEGDVFPWDICLAVQSVLEKAGYPPLEDEDKK